MYFNSLSCASMRRCRAIIYLSISMLFLTPLAQANIYRVGQSGGACTHSTIQAAINAANSNAGEDEVRVTADVSTSGDAYWLTNGLTINTGQALNISGGWENCEDDDWATGFNYLPVSGNGSSKPTLRVRGSGTVNLMGFDFTLGGTPNLVVGEAGGIDYEGTGQLNVSYTRIYSNVGSTGGGMRVSGSGGNIGRVNLGVNVYIYSNTAISGGGIFVGDWGRLDINGPYAFVTENRAEGGIGGSNGGGLYVNAPGYANILTPDSSVNHTGVISSNYASGKGGGIYVLGGTTASAYVQLISPNATETLALRSNNASEGGAIFVETAPNHDFAQVCGRNIAMSGNSSNGSGVVAAVGAKSIIRLGAAACQDTDPSEYTCAPQGQTDCNTIRYNLSNADLIAAEDGGNIELNKMRIDHNNLPSGRVLHALASATSDPSKITSSQSLYEANNSSSLFFAGARSELFMFHNTAADNILPDGAYSFYTQSGGILKTYHDLINQTQPVFNIDPNTLFFEVINMMAPNAIGAPVGTVLQQRAIFVPNGYRLQARSPGVDYAPSMATLTDIDNKPRDVDNPFVQNTLGASDIGAFETQDVSPPIFDLLFREGFESAQTNYANETDFNIPDNNPIGVESPVSVSGLNRNGSAQSLVSVNIQHRFIGDLIVKLISPSNQALVLHNRTGGGTDNLVQSYALDLRGQSADGVWRLSVSDNASLDAGVLNRWEITL